MSHSPDHGRNDPHRDGRPTPEGRRRGRILIPLVILLVIAVIFIYLLVVGMSADDAEQIGAPAHPPVVATAPA